jgi:hypothetical protein
MTGQITNHKSQITNSEGFSRPRPASFGEEIPKDGGVKLEP